MQNRLLIGIVAFVFVVGACSCFLSGSRSPKYEFQPGQEMSLAKTYDEGELPAGAGTEDVVPMGAVFTTSEGHEIKPVAELSEGVIDVNIKFAGESEKTKFQINTATENKAQWEDFVIIPFLRGAQDGKYHFWLWIREK